MHESHVARRSVLLPRRLHNRVPLVGPQESAASVSSGQDAWGLAGRIAALPGITNSCTTLPDGTTATDFFIDPMYVLRSTCSNRQLMCHIDVDGILLPHIGPVDRAEVILKGWALRDDEALTLFLPRDSIEMEIAWQVVLLVYKYLSSKPITAHGKRKRSVIFPSYTSTAKYWM